MRSEKGFTLTSVIIYVIGMVIVVSIISVITGYFYKNVSVNSDENDKMKQYTKFNSYFTQEINLKGNRVLETKTEIVDGKQVSYIVFSSGNQYTFMEINQSIYKNQVKIAEKIESCIFTEQYQNGKQEIKIDFKIGDFEKIGDNRLRFTLTQ